MSNCGHLLHGHWEVSEANDKNMILVIFFKLVFFRVIHNFISIVRIYIYYLEFDRCYGS